MTREDKARHLLHVVVEAPEPTALQQQHHNNSKQQEARACVIVWAWQVRDTGALLSPQVMALGSTNRENMTAGEDVLGDKTSCIISSASHNNMASKEHKQTTKLASKLLFLNLLFFWTPRRHKPSSERHSIYVPPVHTAEQHSIGPAQSSKVHTVVTFMSTRVRRRTQAGMKRAQVRCCWEPCAMYEYSIFLLYFLFPSLLLFQKPTFFFPFFFSKYRWHLAPWRAAV